MASSTGNADWNDIFHNMMPSTEHPFPPDSQPFDQMSFPDTGVLAEGQDWLRTPDSNMESLASVMADSSRPSPSTQKLPSKAVADILSTPRRGSQTYVSRKECFKSIRGITEKLNALQNGILNVQSQLKIVFSNQEKLFSNHQRLLAWTIDMNKALSDLAQQVVDRVGLPVEDDESLMADDEK